MIKQCCANNYNTPNDVTQIIISFGVGPTLPETSEMMIDQNNKEEIAPEILSQIDKILKIRDVLPCYMKQLPRKLYNMQFTTTLLAFAHKLDTFNNTKLIKHKYDDKYQYKSLDHYSADAVDETTILYDIVSQVKCNGNSLR